MKWVDGFIVMICKVLSDTLNLCNAPLHESVAYPSNMDRYCVYILASATRVLYTGVTNNFRRRMNEHKSGKIGGFTSRYRVKRLVYFEEHQSIRDAIHREKVIKKWRREKIISLIESMNPEWSDLMAE